MTYRILSFDGGGIRGILTTALLERLDAAAPGVGGSADMLAGTSTGGIIALGLAYGLKPADLTALYRDHGSSIFDATWIRELESFDGMRQAKYGSGKLRELLQKTFGDTRLRDLKKKVVVPTLSLRDGNPPRKMAKFLTNLDPATQDCFLWQAALMTSAAPTYFPSFGVYVDGGMVANDPAMCAIVRALRAGAKLEEIVLLSFGTGVQYKPIDGEDHDAGLVFWAPKMIDTLLDGNVELAEEQCVALLGEAYCRIDIELGPHAVPLDAWKRVQELMKMANQATIAETIVWLKKRYA